MFRKGLLTCGSVICLSGMLNMSSSAHVCNVIRRNPQLQRFLEAFDLNLSDLETNINYGKVFHHINVPVTSDVNSKTYCSGCELLSIVNLLKFYGFNVNPKMFLDNYFIYQYWRLVDDKVIEGAPHPDVSYPGDPTVPKGDNCGFGCFSNVVKNSINRYFEKSRIEYYASSSSGVSTDDLINSYIRKGIPVVIWCTQPVPNSDFSHPVRLKGSGGPGSSWKIYHSDRIKKIYKFLPESELVNDLDGTNYTWTRGEHCALLVGETENSYILNDPFLGDIYVDKDSLNESRNIFNNQIVVINRK